jgi:polyvinyl alcohol dehydrogenase (cytochrome)
MKPLCVILGVVTMAIWAPAQQPPAPRPDAVFEQACARCHETGTTASKLDRKALRKMTSETIYQSLSSGSMRDRVPDLSDDAKRALAEYLGGKKLGIAEIADARSMPNHCTTNSPLGDLSASPAWNGWGGDLSNTRFQSAKAAGLTAEQAPSLKLKWAFGFPGATAVQGQPTIALGRVFVGVDTGTVYSLDAASGCVYWSFPAEAAVRTAVSIGPWSGGARYAAYFGDLKANVFAVDAATGAQLWKVNVDDHPAARVTGAPRLYENRLYVPVASLEEAMGVQPSYPCCTFRGSVVALDAATGRQIWKTYIIADAPKPMRKTAKGTQLWGPSGGGVWNSPTIDVKRHALYVGTGDAYSEPAGKTTDAIAALDLNSGKLLWAAQDTEGDAWIVGCPQDNRPENCPKALGPDYDFGGSPILRELPNGKSVLIGGQKSGMVWAHDPDKKGAVVWKNLLASTPPPASGQIVWGGAADELNAYYGLATGGVVALQLTNGERRWFAPLDPAPGLRGGHDGAITALPGVVLSGGWDGVLRALAASTGRVLWDFNTAQSFETVNKVAAKGGSMGAPGPTVAGGMVFVGSGNPGVRNGMPGNVLLAFGVE